ncbi:MAG: trypsin-like peptidase domain-containing protein, partial [Actinomycetota bacterium]|nr:trypsin-like peptidase domain-containing protein [Actinomycetota bacterium]MEC8971335.1 trypsin-like peptidase domain-containing protein [Actinomycetota bacterium]
GVGGPIFGLMENDQAHQRRSVDRRSIEVGGRRPVEPTFPGLLPAPVPPIEPPVRISGRLLAGLFAAAVLVAALVAGAVAGWVLRGEGGDAVSSIPSETRPEEAVGTVPATQGLSEAEVTTLIEGVLAAEGLSAAEVTTLVEAVLASEGLSEAEVTVLVEAVLAEEGLSEVEVTALVEAILSEREGLSAADVEIIVADRLSETPGLSTNDVASIAASVVEESAGLSAEEVELLVGRLIEESAGLTAEEVESRVARLFAEAPVDDSGNEPVVAVAEALVDSVVLVSVPDTSHGSGIVFDDGGLIVTNAHVVDDVDEVVVSLPNGRQITAEVVGFDVRRDVAVLQLTEPDDSLVPAVFAFTEDVRVGQLAVALGSPFDLDRTVTSGIVSAIGRVIESYGCQSGFAAECAGVSMIQTDAPINPGNSGGPLADREGRVIGMNTAIQSAGLTTGNIGVGFAIPSDTVVLVARRLILGEPIGTAWLGIRGESTTDGRPGAVVVEVVEGSPAELAGLLVGDRIFRSDGRIIRDMGALRANIQIRLPGSRVELEYERDGELNLALVELGNLDDHFTG